MYLWLYYNCPLSFGLTYMFGYEDEASSVPAEDKEQKLIIRRNNSEPSSISSRFVHYLSVMPVAKESVFDVNDPVFSWAGRCI